MRVLIISGELSSPQRMTYCTPPDWDSRTIDIRSPEITALVSKFDDPLSISEEDIGPCMQDAMSRVLGEIQAYDPTAVLSVGFGADVMAALRARALYLGPTVIVDPYGFYRSVTVLLRRRRDSGAPADAVWVSSGAGPLSHAARHSRQGIGRDRAGTIVSVQSLDDAYATGLISSCVRLAVRAGRAPYTMGT